MYMCVGVYLGGHTTRGKDIPQSDDISFGQSNQLYMYLYRKEHEVVHNGNMLVDM